MWAKSSFLQSICCLDFSVCCHFLFLKTSQMKSINFWLTQTITYCWWKLSCLLGYLWMLFNSPLKLCFEFAFLSYWCFILPYCEIYVNINVVGAGTGCWGKVLVYNIISETTQVFCVVTLFNWAFHNFSGNHVVSFDF